MMQANSDLVKQFVVADYVVFAAMLAVSAGIGVFYACSGGQQKTTKEFLMADRQMSFLPVSVSLLASFMSAITLLGNPTEIYAYGTHFMMIAIPFSLALLITSFTFLPMFHRLGVSTANEYLEKRFNSNTRILGSIFFLIYMSLYMGIVLYAPALALNAVTGLSIYGSVLTVGLVCTFYTSIGGLKAVIWTDVFQVTMMFCGLIAVLVRGFYLLGGWKNVWDTLEKGDRVEFALWTPDPRERHTIWSLSIGGTFTWLSIYGVNQTMVQRYLSIASLKDARRATLANIPGLLVMMLMTCLCGFVVYGMYHDCDPLTVGIITKNDQLLPYLVMDILGDYHGLPGLFVACIFSGALSTLSSGVNAMAAVVLMDIIKPRMPDLTEQRQTLISKGLAIVFGLSTIGVAFLASVLGPVLQAAYVILGMIGGPTLGLFSLGMFVPGANSTGAITGALFGLAVTCWISAGTLIHGPAIPTKPISVLGCDFISNASVTTTVSPSASTLGHDALRDSVYSISYMWYALIGCLSCIIFGSFVSYCTGWSVNDSDNKYSFEMEANIFNCAKVDSDASNLDGKINTKVFSNGIVEDKEPSEVTSPV